MDVRTISGAAHSRPPVAVTPADIASPLDETKGGSSAAPYLSPVYHFDPVAKLAILSYRDPNSGAVTTQIPSEKVVEQYRRTRGASPDAIKATPAPKTADTAVPASQESAPPRPGRTESSTLAPAPVTATTTTQVAAPPPPANGADAPTSAATGTDPHRVSLSV